jgi:chemotaxis protein CheY-P-specific phosphatase CheC
MGFTLPLNENQRDCLQELSNVAMGAAAESLAKLTQRFVHLPIPIIRCVATSELVSSFDQIAKHLPASVISQNCTIGELPFRGLMIVGDASIETLAADVERTLVTEEENEELLHELFDTITHRCFEQLGEMFEMLIERQGVVIQACHILPELFDMKSIITTSTSNAVEINYKIESNNIDCHLLLLFPDNIFKKLADQLDILLN